MKKILFLLLISNAFVSEVFATSLKGTAEGLGQEAVKIGLGLGIFALVVAGIYLSLGKQEGGQKVSFAVMGIIVILSAQTIVTTLKSVVGGA